MKELWDRASIPTVCARTISSRNGEAFECGKICEWRFCEYSGRDSLFEICACVCPQVECNAFGCKEEGCEEIHIQHSTKFSQICRVKLDPKEVPFLMDQRGARVMIIGGVHMKDSLVLKKHKQREAALKAREEAEKN